MCFLSEPAFVHVLPHALCILDGTEISYWSDVHWCATKSNVSIASGLVSIFCFTTLQFCCGVRAASPNILDLSE
jgi:hypothetical protein